MRECARLLLAGVLAVGLRCEAQAKQAGVMRPVKIVLVGDSTVATEGGWGPGFCGVLTASVACVDLALNGRSSRSFIDEGAWARALAEGADYYLIQFGHNDQKPDAARHTDAEGSYRQYLKRYIADVRGIGGVPVLVTSLSRRTFQNGRVIEDLKAYAEATREVGAEEGVTVVDLNRISTALLNGMTQEQADGLNATGHADARAEGGKVTLDRTHLNAHGQEVFGRMVAAELVRQRGELRPVLKAGTPYGKQVGMFGCDARLKLLQRNSGVRVAAPISSWGRSARVAH